MYTFIFNLAVSSVLITAVSFVISLVSKRSENPTVIKGCYYAVIMALTGFLYPLLPVNKIGFISIPISNGNETTNTVSEQITSLEPYAVVFVLWLCTAVFFLLFNIFRQISFIKTLNRHAVSCDDETVVSIAKNIFNGMKIKSRISIKIISILETPAMTGFFKPVIYLPRKNYTENELIMILSHELTHFKHHDIWMNALFVVCQSFHWFNPFFLLLKKDFDRISEYYCDYDVTKAQSRNQKKQYCSLILNTAQRESKTGTAPLCSSFHSSKKELKNRMSIILSESKKSYTFVISAVFIAVILFSSLLFTAVKPENTLYNNTNSDSQAVETTTVEIRQNVTSTAEYYPDK